MSWLLFGSCGDITVVVRFEWRKIGKHNVIIHSNNDVQISSNSGKPLTVIEDKLGQNYDHSFPPSASFLRASTILQISWVTNRLLIHKYLSHYAMLLILLVVFPKKIFCLCFVFFCHSLEEGVDTEGLDVCTPVSSVFVLRGVICVHNAIFDCRPSSSEITAIEVSFLRQHSHHFCFWDRGNWRLKVRAMEGWVAVRVLRSL